MAVLVVAMTAGCPATRGAYQAAERPDEYAYVVAENYNALVNEAADVAEQASTPQEVKDALKLADQKAKPLVLKLRPLADAYTGAANAETQAALQAALNQAVLAVADFIRELRKAQGKTTIGVSWNFESQDVLRRADAIGGAS